MLVCPFRLIGKDSLPAGVMDATRRLSEPQREQLGCIGPMCALFKIRAEDLNARRLDRGWCSLRYPET
jgi:hypothetical protein